MPKKFIIIDGSSLVHRAFYALPLLQTANGQYTNAAYGFTTMLVKLLEKTRPDLIAVAFDKGKITFRNELYTAYKAQRKATPSELSQQFALVKELLAAFGICVLEAAGYEADDIIGTLSLQAENAGHEVMVVTGDKDALQLISANTKVMLTKKGISEMEMMDSLVFQEKYGVVPAQQIDVKGLMGDTSDNIPGVPGVGEKTALKLIAAFQSVENVLDNIEKVAGKKLQENLKNNTELALLSKRLATIERNMPLVYKEEDYVMCPNVDKVQALFLYYEFKSLQGKVGNIFPGNTKTVVAETTLPEVEWLSGENVDKWLQRITESKTMYFYPILSGRVPNIVMRAVAVYCDGKIGMLQEGEQGWENVFSLLGNPYIKKITHDAKNMFHACRAAGANFAGLAFDTVLAAYLLEPTTSQYSITDLGGRYLGYCSGMALEDAYDHAAVAVSLLPTLWENIKKSLACAGLEELYSDIELPLVEVLAAMEAGGIQVDVPRLKAMAKEIGEKIALLLRDIYQQAGEEFNVNSTKQLGYILFDKLQLPVIKKTKTGYSTDVEVLEKLAGQHEIIDNLLEYRMLTKLKSTYLDGLEPLIHAETGRLYTTFNQTVTATGRLSSSEPNLQNIPIRNEIGKKIRELFIPGSGYDYIMAADYSQIELRILADMSRDKNLMEAFFQSQDVHTRTAAEVFEVPMAEVSAEMRSRAKAVNFGIVYGISDYGLSKDIGVSRKMAGQYIESYFSKYSGVKVFLDTVIKNAHTEGYVVTLLGRRRYLPDINSSNFNLRSFAERTAMNTPIQGTAADIIKKAMLNVYRMLQSQGLKSRILLQVHDELILEVSKNEVDIVSRLVKQCMEESVKLLVPLLVDVKVGENWAKTK